MRPNLLPATYIETDAALLELVNQLAGEPLLAVDTESNSLYAYQSRVCLIQLSTRGHDYIIDPLAIDDIQPFGALLADERIEKIFHAAEYDLISLRRDFGFEVQHLFDTMYAAQLCQIEPFGLADMLCDFLDVEVDKRHQLDNWGQRPLDSDSLLYAQMDTHYLPALRDIVMDKLVAKDRLPEAREVFRDVLRIEAKNNHFDPDGYWKIGRPRGLNRRQMTVLRELYLVRDGLARHEDVPPFKIISNAALVSIARLQPRRLSGLHDIKSMSGRQVRLYGDELLSAIERGRANRPPRPPKPDYPDPLVAERYTELHQWRKELGSERGLDSSLILAKQTLWELAEKMPGDMDELRGIEGIGEWRLQAYGPDILNLLASLR